MKKIFTWFLIFASVIAQAQFKTLTYLQSISGKQTLAGQEGRQYWNPMKTITGHYPALWGEDFSFSNWGGTSSMAAWRTLITGEAKQRWTDGAVISMMFHACPPTQAEPCNWDGGVKSKLTDAQWTELITDGSTLNKNWKARLDVIVPYLLDLKNNGVEVLFRPLHEMNQGVFWWAGRPGANGTVKLYQITHDYLVNVKGLTNLIWVWDLQDFSTLSADVNNYYPGENYFDVAALDIYWSDGTGITATKYNTMLKIAAGKPIAIGELDVLPTASELTAFPKWTFFMGWCELTQQKNSNTVIQNIYKASNVAVLDKMPGWANTADVNVMNTTSENLIISPNPVKNGYFTINLKGFKENSPLHIKMMDSTGKEVYNATLNDFLSRSKSTEIQCVKFSNGLYLVSVEGAGVMRKQKVIISK